MIKDGACHINRNAKAKHSANMVHKAEFQNATITLRFQLMHAKDAFQLQFRDDNFKEVKQGMLFTVRIADGKLQLTDNIIGYGVRPGNEGGENANADAGAAGKN